MTNEIKDKDATFTRGLKYILGGIVLQAGLFGSLALVAPSPRENTIIDPYCIRQVQDTNRDGTPDRTKTVIYGPSFGIDLGYRPCSNEESQYFYSNFKSAKTGKEPEEK